MNSPQMMDLKQTVTSFNAIRIVIVPIGPVPSSKFKFYYDIISSCNTAYLHELPTPEAYSNGPFPNRDWKSATIHLNFESRFKEEDFVQDEWGSVLANRRVMGVIGIALCHQYPDLSVAKQQFSSVVQSFTKDFKSPNVVSSKCFCFEPLPDQPDLERGNMIMIPNGIQMLSFYIKTQVHDLAVSVLQVLYNWVGSNYQFPSPEESNELIVAPGMEENPSSLTVDSKKQLKRRKPFRLSKLKGDWCMLCGSPTDALLYFNSALEVFRTSDETVWLAASLEGWVAAILSDPDAKNRISEQEVIEKYTEIITIYMKKKALHLAVEASIKLARYLIQCGKKRDACELMMETYDSINELRTNSKILVTSTIALLFKEMDYMRKFAFFLRETAVLYHKDQNPAAAHTLLKIICKYYQLDDLDEITTSFSRRTGSPYGNPSPYNPNTRRLLKDKTSKDWNYLQRIMLQNLIRTSKSINDPHSTVRYCLYLLKSQNESLSDTLQRQYAKELIDSLQNLPSLSYGSLEIDSVGFPVLKKMTPLGVDDHLMPVTVSTKSISKGKAFEWLYTPYQNEKKGEKQICWIQNEYAKVKVELTNPTSIDLDIQNIEICTHGGVKFETYGVSCIIPAKTPSFELILTGKPLNGPGTVNLCGCRIKCFNLTGEHPINSQGVGISMKEYQHNLKFPPKDRTPRANQVTVFAELPLLDAIEISSNGSNLRLLEGERYTCIIELTNIGKMTVNNIQLEVHEKKSNYREPLPSPYELSEAEKVFQWNETLLAPDSSLLPLLPGKKIRFPVHILGKLTSFGGEFTFNYSCKSNTEFARSVKLNIPFRVNKGLEINSFDILSSSSSDFPGLYANSSFCLLVFEVANSTTRTFNVTGIVNDVINKDQTETHRFSLESQTVSKIILPLRRFTLDPQNIPPIPEQKRQYVKPAKELSEKQKFELRMRHWYKQEILNHVRLTWSCLAFNTSGVLELRNKIKLGRKMIERLNVDFVTFSFDFGNRGETNKYLQRVSCHEMIKVTSMITNLEGNSNSLSFQIQPFLDLENGQRDTNVGGKMAWGGKLQEQLELKSKETFSSNIEMCFILPGVYKLICICNKPSGAVCRSKVVTIIAK